MKKNIILLLLFCFSGSLSVSLANKDKMAKDKKSEVGGLLEQIAQEEAARQVRPVQDAEKKLAKRVDTVEGALGRYQKGLEELGSTEVENPKTRWAKLAGCFGAGASVAAVLLLLL